MVNKKSRNCPICNYQSNFPIFTQKFAGGLEHKIVVCDNCGFVFVKYTYDRKTANKHYKKNSKYNHGRDENLHEIYAKIIQQYCPPTSKILDVGCSDGHLLYLLRQKGFKSLDGFDPSPQCQIAASRKYKIKIRTAELYSFDTRRKYDIIILAQVLEHLVDIKQAIQKLSSILSGNGYFFIALPDADNFYKDFEEPFYEFSLEHINFFGVSALHALMHDFQPIHFTSDGKVIFSLWQKSGGVRNSLKKYIRLSKAKMARINRVIDNCPDRLIVWGAGSLTERLFTSTKLAQKTIKLADRNLNLAGKKLIGIEIIPPEKLRSYKEPVLISSFRFKDEILKDIKKMGIKNKIITF